MKQTVLIGLGGTGSRSVNNVAKLLHKKSIKINDGVVTCAVLDTNKSDSEIITGSGTEIPVIRTSDIRNIDQYLSDNAFQTPLEWCPYSERFGEETMIDGASEMRFKSRLAFMDLMEKNERISKLKDVLAKVLPENAGTDDKIRVMVVSSLAGGTGSGMFIQVALWLRKFFESKGSVVTIRGILLLPDIFIETVRDIKRNPRKVMYHYANAYAAVRELNSIDKVAKRRLKPTRPIVIKGLFDSDNPPAKTVFDNAFFIDNEDSNGVSFKTLGGYERLVAQIVYMQLYAPMQREMFSVEDNSYRAFEKSTEPVFGSCGTAMAEYPVEDVIEYCALSAARDSVSSGWGRIDSDIDEMINQEENAIKDGAVIIERISRRDTFVKLFDEKAGKRGAEIGIDDQLFVRIKKDVVNEHREVVNGNERSENEECKAEHFINLVTEEIHRTVTQKGGLKRISQIVEDIPDHEAPDSFYDGLTDELKGIRAKEKETINKVLKEFDENSKVYADEIIRTIVPLDMGSVNENDEKTVFGLFKKKDLDGNDHFVHPVAAKYLMYKLTQKIKEIQGTLVVESRRKSAITGDTSKVSFDNPKTRRLETMEGYWGQVGWHISKAEIAHFIKKYKEYNTENKNLCMQYETELLTQLVLKDLSAKLNDIISVCESLFDSFSEYDKDIKEKIENNVQRNKNDFDKVLYIYAQREHKDAKYRSLGIDIAANNDAINETVIKSIYGKFCAKHRPNNTSNTKYTESDIAYTFERDIVNSYIDVIEQEHKAKIDISIIKAIQEESDYNYNKQTKDKKDKIEDRTLTESERRAIRHYDAIKEYGNKLLNKSAPFLHARPESTLTVVTVDGEQEIDTSSGVWMEDENGKKILVPFQTELTFWGFHPDLLNEFSELEEVLSVNADTASNDGYDKNEIYCYSSIYGVKAEAIDKFNEEKGGVYYTNYTRVINSMIRDSSEVDTPHIDKTWHEFLPYVNSSRDKKASQSFALTFWRAIAYGRVILDRNGNYQMVEHVLNDFGDVVKREKPLLEEGRSISAKEVLRLVNALKVYPGFELELARTLEQKFEEDVEGMKTYIGTDIIKGLITEGELNPVDMVVRYNNARDCDENVRDNLIGALNLILTDIASRYDKNRGEEEIHNAKVRLCHRIYEKSNMSKKNLVFESWIPEFKRLRLCVDEEIEGDNTEAEETEDII